MDQLINLGNKCLCDGRGGNVGVIYDPLALLNTDNTNILTLTCSKSSSSSSSHYNGDTAGVGPEVEDSRSGVISCHRYATRSYGDLHLHSMLDDIQTCQHRRKADARTSGRESATCADQRSYSRVGVRVRGARKGKPRSAQKLSLKRGEEVTLSYGTAYTRHVTRQHQSP